MSKRTYQVGRQPIDEPVDVRRLDDRRVEAKADRGSPIVDADEQRSAVGIEEAGDRLYHGVFHPLVLARFAEVPASGGLELHLIGLVTRDQLFAWYGEERFVASQLLGDELGERGVRGDAVDDRARDRVDVYRRWRSRDDRRDVGAGLRGRGLLSVVVHAVPVVVEAGEDVVEDDVNLALPGRRVIRLG